MLKELFILLIGIGLGYILMKYVSTIADNALVFGIILIVIGVIGKVMVK